MRKHGDLGAVRLAAILGRSVYSVRMAAHRHRISIRTKGSRRGLVLGQPRGVSIARSVRTDLARDRSVSEAVARRLTLSGDLELCPCCGVRPVAVRTTGWCRPCHLARLSQAHREELSEIEAQRELWRTRQAAKRARSAFAQEVAACRQA